jgi:hypothetical protein
MSEQQNKIPLPGEQDAKAQVPDFLKGDDWFEADVSQDFLDFDEPYRPPRYTMEREGVPFADVGELHIISGKPGNGKTGLMSQLEAATLGGQFGKTIARQVGHIQRDDEGNIINDDTNRPIYQPRPTRILHIDTEQGKDDTIAFKNRVISMSGIDPQEAKEHFFILRLRDTETAKERWRKILKAIWQVGPTDIFLDGMLDIVEDYNDQVECQPIIRKCMMLATHYDTSLWAVLHENPMVDKLVGTLGSITQRKVSEIFSVIKVKQCDLKPNEQRPDLPDIYFRVKQNKARGRDVQNWLFQYVTNQGGWGQPVEIEDNGKPATEPKPKDNEQELLKFIVRTLGEFMAPPKSDYFTNIVKELKNRMHVGETKAKTYFNMANDEGVFHRPVNGRYTLDTQQCDAILNDLPFAPQGDE